MTGPADPFTPVETEMWARRGLLDAIEARIRAGSLTERQRAALGELLADIAYHATHDDPQLPPGIAAWAEVRDGWAELVAAMTEPRSR